MWDLHHQSDAVAGLAAGVLARAVLQLLHDLQRVIHRAVILLPFYADHGTDTARVVFERRPIQRVSLINTFRHNLSPQSAGSHSFQKR